MILFYRKIIFTIIIWENDRKIKEAVATAAPSTISEHQSKKTY